jgi:hypothetical protein
MVAPQEEAPHREAEKLLKLSARVVVDLEDAYCRAARRASAVHE